MKKSTRNLLLALALFLVLSSRSKVEAKLIKDVKDREVLSTGVTYVDIDRFTDKGWIDIGVLKLDTQNPYSDLVPLISPNGTSTRASVSQMMADDQNIVGGINGDYFTYGRYPMALGSLYGNDQLVLSTPELAFARNNFYIKKDGTAGVGNLPNHMTITNLTNGHSASINALNKVSAPFSAISMLDYNWGSRSPGRNLGSNVTEVLIVNNTVVDKRVGGQGFDIPLSGKVLTQVGPDLIHFNPGDQVQIDLGSYEDLSFSIGGGNILVKDGQVQSGLPKTRAPRTAIGINDSGSEVLLVTVDGRNNKSIGMGEQELAEFMRSIGAVQALNLDGGGSTTMAIRRPDNKTTQVVNDPSDGGQRQVADGVGIRSEAPLTGPSYIKINSEFTEVFPGFSYPFQAQVYDEYHHLLDISQEDIDFSFEDRPSDSSYFSPQTPGRQSLVASYQGATGSLDILVRQPISEMFLNVDSLDLNFGQSYSFENIYGINNQGYKKSIPTSMVTFDIVGDIGSIENGVFTAGQNPGSGTIIASFNGVSKVIPLSVGYYSEELYRFAKPDDISLSCQPNDPSIAGAKIIDTNDGIKINYSVVHHPQARKININFLSPIKISSGDKLALNLDADGKGASMSALLRDQEGKDHKLELTSKLDSNDNISLSADLPNGMDEILGLEIEVKESVQIDSVLSFRSISLLSKPKQDISEMPISSQAIDERNFIMEDPDARISIGSVKVGDTNKMAHMSESDISYLYNGMGLSSVTSPVKINGLSSFRVDVGHNTRFITLDTNGSSLRSANPDQWPHLLEALESSPEKNIVIIGHQDPSLLSGPKEKELFDSEIQKALENGKNIFIIHDGPGVDIRYGKGIRKITFDMEGNSKKVLDLYIKGDSMSFALNNIE